MWNIDIVQFIFTWFVVYYLEQKLSLYKKLKNNWKELIGEHLVCNLPKKANYTSHN